MSKPVTIDILLDGKRYAMRTWHNVPRVGDVIQLRGGELHAEVRRVVWDEAGTDAHYYDCWVQLICETVTDIKADMP